MSVESVAVPQDLNASWPAAGDPRSEGDDHIRNTKTAVLFMGLEKIELQTASAAAQVTFTHTFVAGYDYIVIADGVYTSGGGGVSVRVRNSGVADSGSNYAYAHTGWSTVGAADTGSSAGTTSFPVCGQTGDATAERSGFEIEILNPADTGNARTILFRSMTINSAVSNMYYRAGGCLYRSTTAVDGFHIGLGGTITGNFCLYRRTRPS
jgi:hypothetical protein